MAGGPLFGFGFLAVRLVLLLGSLSWRRRGILRPIAGSVPVLRPPFVSFSRHLHSLLGSLILS